METIKCLKCGKEVPKGNYKLERKFCGPSCRNAYNSNKNYHKNIKNNPEKMEKARIRSRLWYLENSRYHNKRSKEKYDKKKNEIQDTSK